MTSVAEHPYDAKTVARFWSKVDKNGPVPEHMPHLGPCWVWTGAVVFGYGHFVCRRMAPDQRKAHRVSWELANGAIPIDMLVMHKCDNRACVNPSHLTIGTPDDNMKDMVAKGRQCHPRGEANNHASLTEDVIVRVRQLKALGLKQTDIAEACGISKQNVSRIVLRQRWAHVA